MLLNELKQYKPYSISPGYNAKQITYGLNPIDNEIIKGTTYNAKKENSKAIEGLVSNDINKQKIFFYNHKSSLLFVLENESKKEYYLEYSLNDDHILIAGIESSNKIYPFILTVFNYLYNEYKKDQYESLYQLWYNLNMNDHLSGQNWDANEYQSIHDISLYLIQTLDDILLKNDDYLSLYYDSVEELMEYYHISFETESLMEKYFFHQSHHLKIVEDKKRLSSITKNDYQILDIQPLFTPEEIESLPLFLQLSIQDNQELYLKNRAFLDMNDFDLIKSFYRGKTWSCLYYGPSGTGKTTKTLCVAGALGLPSLKIVGSRAIDEASLFGKYVLRNGETVFEYGPLALMMKYGGMFIFDEINMVDSDIIASLNDVLDGTKQKILDNGEIIHAHRNFRFAESMNIGYTGTNEMNISHKSRIQNKIKISKLSVEKMKDILVKETEIDERIAMKMASLLDAFNNVIINLGNETTQRIDLRTLINWANKTVDLDGDVIRASLVTIISELAEEDDEIENLEDVKQIMATTGGAGAVMEMIVKEFRNDG
ncbi:MAG: AAA family ATPase [Faecalibacillus sp.]